MIPNPPTIIADSPLLDGYNSTACSVYEFPLPPPPVSGKQLRHQESLVAISSRNLNLLPKRQGYPASRAGRTLAVDWDAASDWSWDAESCISARPGRTLRNKTSNAALSLQPQPQPKAISTDVSAKAKRRQTMAPVPPPSQRGQPMIPSRNQQAALFASTSMPERTLGDRTSFLQLDESPAFEAPSSPFAQSALFKAKPYLPASRLAPSSSLPEMKGGVLSGADDIFAPEISNANTRLRPNRQTMIPVDHENRCSAFDRFEASIAKLRAHAPSPSPLGTHEPALAPPRPQFPKPHRPMDRHTYSPASQPHTPDAAALRQVHKSRWRDTPLPDIPPHVGTMLKSANNVIPSPRPSTGTGLTSRPRSNPATPRSVQTPRPAPPPLLPSPAIPAFRNPVLGDRPGRVPMSQKRSPDFMNTPSVPPVLTSFMNMSPEQRVPGEKESQDRAARVKKLLRKASMIGWWKKRGKGKEGL
ncbi:hypothetical protein NEOLEDRAFT_1168640 [Neolentinus lepideus HHB14362 ss-1]|uniref:Uncharacterized protein n=1 Tax=Neolentinus lepideus HHB14362 ss-1 TaxID=1314782 RepID=A0A165TJQ4_9AGAM|nr:hypothetical protein NEOLEDRAFT_1168640 [Neolentinus lepideus HHB14362 ss-1]